MRSTPTPPTTPPTDVPPTVVPPTDDPQTEDVEPAGSNAAWLPHRTLLVGVTLFALALGGTAVFLELTADDLATDGVATDVGADADADADAVTDAAAGDRVDPEAVDGELPIDTDVPTGTALCAVVQSPETLVERDLVFIGTVLSISGDAVNFDVEEVLQGEPGDQVQLGGAEFLATANPDNVNPITVGERYLVAGDDGFAWGCGFTHLYDEDVATTWRNAFAS